jgi:predicted TIM-barrel fold metal-dependent hydrolase
MLVQRRQKFFARCACCESVGAATEAPRVNRRNFLASGASLALGASGISAAISQAVAAPAAARKRIDIHHHFAPTFHRDMLGSRRPGSWPNWSVQISLEDMDKSGIALAFLSSVNPGAWTGNVEESRVLARKLNEYSATVVRDHPLRFGHFATISPPDVEGSLKEIDYGLGTLKADGIALMTSYAGKYLGDESFAPVYEELNRRKALVYVHPTTPQCCGSILPGIPASAIEYGTDTTRTIAQLVFNGTAKKYPDIRWLFSHSGGTMPFLTGRFVRLWNERKPAHLPEGPLPEFKKFYYELAQGNTSGQIAALLKMVPLSQVLYGTDFPFRDGAEVNAGIAAYGFKPNEVRSIEREVAIKLIPRLKTV